MFVALMTTGTAVAELMVVSGKLKGFALIATPLILATVMTGGGTVGRLRAKGSDVTDKPANTVAPFPLMYSKRARPGCAAVLQTFPGPAPVWTPPVFPF